MTMDRHTEGKRKPKHSGAASSDARYTVGELAELSGVSARTLRHYEDVGLLKPARTASGYRSYTESDARRLAHILAMRSCDLPLPTIRRILDDPSGELRSSLEAHLQTLRAQESALAEAIARTKRTIAAIERMDGMDTRSAFEATKAEGLRTFEETYGREARERYGSEAIDATNERLMALDQNEWDAKELLEESIKVQLRIALADGDPAGDAAKELAHMHERWIRIHWGGSYSQEAYQGLVRGYLADPRFCAYYDGAAGKGATDFLVRAVEANLKAKDGAAS